MLRRAPVLDFSEPSGLIAAPGCIAAPDRLCEGGNSTSRGGFDEAVAGYARFLCGSPSAHACGAYDTRLASMKAFPNETHSVPVDTDPSSFVIYMNNYR
jgi:hypothetical protein